MKKWLIGSILCILIIVVIFLYGVFMKDMDTKDEIIKVYNNNTQQFINIAKYAKDTEGNIYINKNANDGEIIKKFENMKLSKYEITNLAVENDIKNMVFKLNFKIISEKENSVRFIKANGLGFDRGILYIKDGSEPNSSDDITIIKKLKDGWYYYENNN